MMYTITTINNQNMILKQTNYYIIPFNTSIISYYTLLFKLSRHTPEGEGLGGVRRNAPMVEGIELLVGVIDALVGVIDALV